MDGVLVPHLAPGQWSSYYSIFLQHVTMEVRTLYVRIKRRCTIKSTYVYTIGIDCKNNNAAASKYGYVFVAIWTCSLYCNNIVVAYDELSNCAVCS